MVAQLGPLFGTTGHKVKTQGITPSSGQKRRDIEIINYLSDSAGSRNLVIDLSGQFLRTQVFGPMIWWRL